MCAMNECVEYLKQSKGFSRLMEGMYDLYVRYERCFGAVRLARPTMEEEKAISEFFGRDYYDQALIRISLADFERQTQKRFSAEIHMEALLEAYFGKQISLRIAPRSVNAFAMYVENNLTPRYVNTEAEEWLREVIAHVRRVYRAWADHYTIEAKVVAHMMVVVCDALQVLPCLRGEIIRLPEFAEKYAGNAHALDMNSECGALFLRALTCKFGTLYPSSPEECTAMYYKAGLLSEGVLSHVAVRGLRAWCGEEPDEAVNAYDRRNEAHVLTLENLNRLTQLKPHQGHVFVMENMSVFSAVGEQLSDVPCTLLCPDGGFNGAFMYLADKLCKDGVSLHYSGDMDYAGLSQADRLYLKYPQNFVPWRFNKADYERIMSNSDLFVPGNKKDVGLYNEDLAALLSQMHKRGKTAPQSALIADLAEDVRSLLS